MNSTQTSFNKPRSILNPLVYLSRYHMPTMREDPQDAQIISHKAMLRSGMIRQSAAGIYSWLPLGYRVLRKIEQIVREEQDNAGAHEILMATIQPADLWRQSGRYEDYGQEMLRITDRHERDMLYGPTNEEVVTALFRDTVKSYRDLPQMLYHIQWKFRDEVRPRFGVMRGREFLMKDGYSFDLDAAAGLASYRRMFVSYLRTFARLGLKAIPMRADTGPIGGDASHEFIILAETGESEVFCDKRILDLDPFDKAIDMTGDLSSIVEEWTTPYAATEEEHDSKLFAEKVPAEYQVKARGIEVGHVFFFGDKYSKPMDCLVRNSEGNMVPVQSGSYGIGVSRLVGGIIEACHDENGIVWPANVAPFHVAIVNLKTDDQACNDLSREMAEKLVAGGLDVCVDDRDLRGGEKFADMDLIGCPWQLIIGPRGMKTNTVELKDRKTNERFNLSHDDAITQLINS